jgi:hypothetical protein
MVNRIIGVFTFRAGVYNEVEHDHAFTLQAWLLVVVVSFLDQFGSVVADDIGTRLVAAALATVGAVLAFALAAFVISWTGTTFFDAEVTFGQMVRVLGLAYVWRIVGFLAIIASLSTALTILFGPILVVAVSLGLLAWFIAIREALDLSITATIGVLIIALVMIVIFVALYVFLLSALGLTAFALESVIALV